MEKSEQLIFTKDPVVVNGQVFGDLPDSLYVPPKALRVVIESFDGPLDLLLFLIKKQNIDILDIPMAKIAAQYMSYVHVMHDLELNIVSDYLVMAAMLAQIKSKMLLPKVESLDDEEDDPRAELVRRLQEYEKYKKIAEKLDDFPRLERDIFSSAIRNEDIEIPKKEPSVDISELFTVFRKVLTKAAINAKHMISKETFSVRERMVNILDSLSSSEFVDFTEFFHVDEGKMGIIVTFVAILELIKQNLVFVMQSGVYANIYIKRK